MPQKGQFSEADITPSTGQFSEADLASAPAGSTTLARQSEPQDKPGMLSRAWNWVNKGLVSPETIGGDAYSANKELLGPTGVQAPHGDQSPMAAGVEQFLRGFSKDTVDTASGLTSPLSLAMVGLGAAGGAAEAAPQLATAAQVIGKGAGVGMGLKGVADVTQAATSPNMTPIERTQLGLGGASMMAGGAASLKAPVDTTYRTTQVMHEPASIAKDMPKIAGTMTLNEVDQLAAANGIDLSFGQAIRSRGGRATDWMAEQAINPQFRNAQKANFDAVDSWINTLRDDVSYNPMSHEGAAKDLVKQIGDRAQADRTAVQAAYDNIMIPTASGKLFPAAKAVNNVDLQATRNLVKAAITDPSTGQPLTLNPDAQVVFDKVMKFVDDVSRPRAGLTSFSQAKEVRSHLMDLASTNDPAKSLPPQQRRILGSAVATVDDAIDSALTAKGGAQASQAWRQANQMHKTWKSTYENGGTINDAWDLYQAKSRGNVTTGKETESILKQVLSNDSPQDMAMLRSKGVNMGQLQQLVLDNIRSTKFRRTIDPKRGIELGGYHQDTLGQIFSDQPGVLRELLAAADTYRTLAVRGNPSETGSTIRYMKLGSQATSAATGLAMGNPAPLGAAIASEIPFSASSAAAASPKVKALLTRRATSTMSGAGLGAPAVAAAGSNRSSEIQRRKDQGR